MMEGMRGGEGALGMALDPAIEGVIDFDAILSVLFGFGDFN
jgi:hypothetical protein